MKPGGSEEELKATHAEIRAQRSRIGELLGQLRDTQHDHDSDAVQRLTTENAALKQRLRDFAATNRTLDERLHAARSNNRFLDKRRRPRSTADRCSPQLI